MEKIGAEVIPLYCDSDGTFPNHHPDPTVDENLVDLIDTVRACTISFTEKCDAIEGVIDFTVFDERGAYHGGGSDHFVRTKNLHHLVVFDDPVLQRGYTTDLEMFDPIQRALHVFGLDGNQQDICRFKM